ncbi:MAG: DNA polymerase I, partial [Paramuribaculum sp.]|nr:DNA polymerase I [Paramuribaculum sp.]
MPHTQQPRLFLLDAYALIYRAYYALIRSPRVTSSGFNTSAIFGFCNTLDELLRKEDPSHIAVCFDPPHGATFRHEAFEAYKANREKQPEDITAAIPYIKRILEAYRIRMVECEGYEADDVIGTLSREASEQGFFTYMMTPDKDYAQLVNENVVQYRPNSKGGGFELRGPAEVCEVFGVSSPLQVIDLLALEGDKVDNIPGCPGVGEKTAVQLIATYGSVENLIEHVSELKGALKVKIENNVQQILDSKFLATICTSVPLPEGVCPSCFTREEPDYDKLREIYKELEFNTMLKRLPAGSETKAEKPVAAPVDDFGMGSLFDLPAAVEVSAATDITFETLTTDDVAKLGEIVGE